MTGLHRARLWARLPGVGRRTGGPDRRLRRPAVRLKQRGQAYVEWAVGHPTAYRVLFVDPLPAGGEQGPGAGFTHLLGDLGALSGRSTEDPALFVEALAHWSAVHGLAGLAASRPELPERVRTVTLERLTSALAACR
ncbi:MAG TPA: TetR-like C-terminal domain-containing protein [Dermatophilaceae bacterium]|nr:TetR-like C-terminal domain-containing protein [Dermatophilaceae bacterium]